MADLTRTWDQIRQNASRGLLEFDPQAAITAAEASAALVGRLLAMKQAITTAGLDDLVTITDVDGTRHILGSGLQLTGVYEAKARDLQNALQQHIDIVSDLGETFVWAGRNYIDTDTQSGQSLLQRLNAITMPTTPGDYSLDLSGAGYDNPISWSLLGGRVVDAGLAGTADDYWNIGAFDLPSDLRSSTGSTDTAAAAMVHPENAYSLGFRTLYELGQHLMNDGQRVHTAAESWLVLTQELRGALDDFVTQVNGVGKSWEGQGATEAQAAGRRWVASIDPLLTSGTRMSQNLQYTSQWLTRTAVSMPQTDISAQLTASNMQAVLNHYRMEWSKHYGTGIVNSAGAVPVIEGPVRTGRPRRQPTGQPGEQPPGRAEPLAPGQRLENEVPGQGNGDLPEYRTEQDAYAAGYQAGQEQGGGQGHGQDQGSGQGAGVPGLDQGQGQGAGVPGLDQGQGQGAGLPGLDQGQGGQGEGQGQGAGVPGLDQAQGQGAGVPGLDQGQGQGQGEGQGQWSPPESSLGAATPPETSGAAQESGGAQDQGQGQAGSGGSPGGAALVPASGGVPAEETAAGVSGMPGVGQGAPKSKMPKKPTVADVLAQLTGVDPADMPEELANIPITASAGEMPSLADALAQITGTPVDQMPQELRDMPLSELWESTAGAGIPGDAALGPFGGATLDSGAGGHPADVGASGLPHTAGDAGQGGLAQTIGLLADQLVSGIEAFLQLGAGAEVGQWGDTQGMWSSEQLGQQLRDLVSPGGDLGMAGLGGGGGAGGGLPGFGAAAVAEPLPPYHEARASAFPRASVAGPALAPVGFGGVSAGSTGSPMGGGMPGAPMMGGGGMGGAGTGGSQNEHKPSQYLNSKNNLDEVFEGSLGRVKPVIEQ
ncbi:hypothetical protein [Nocardia harenae]|uniref:hypothetical protein n=1 Tax=Nocardia harenae TaxID=358707 RepID=UPI00082EAD20|nr:hypothetical protein [Nocardia harenae]